MRLFYFGGWYGYRPYSVFGAWAIGYELIVVSDVYLVFVECGHVS